VRVFAANLRDLLLAAPAGARATMGLDPGYRTGVKVAVVDATGKIVATSVTYPKEPQRQWNEALAILGKLATQHKVGRSRRQRHRLARDVSAQAAGGLPKMSKIVVARWAPRSTSVCHASANCLSLT
jgi:uncharacterized protein